MMRAVLAGALLFGAVTSSAQTVIRYDGGGRLEARWRWAVESARDVESSSGFWVGYSFTRMMCRSCYSGTIWDRGRGDRPTLAELISGVRADDELESLRDVTRSALDELDGRDELVPKEMAVLFRFDRNGRVPLEIEMTNLSLHFDPGSRPILWIDGAQDDQSVALLRTVFESGRSIDVRKGAVWAIGMHDTAELAVPFLSGVLSSNEPTEIRKSAAYSLGNQGTDGALRILRSTALDDAEPDVSKAAVYAIGNIDKQEALETLTGIAEFSQMTEVRKAAVYSIANLDVPEAVDALKDVLASDQSMEVRKAAVYALGNMDSVEARNVLMALVANLN